jgi:ribosome-associated translation inhibitor RaiA
MLRSIEFKHVTAKEELRELSDELTAKVEKKVKSFPQKTVYLRVVIEEVVAKGLWTVSATLDFPGMLDFPGKIIAAKEEARDAHAAIRAAFAELERQIDAYKASLRGEQFWKRRSRRKELRVKQAGVAAAKQEDGEGSSSR